MEQEPNPPRSFPVNFNYAINVAPLMPALPQGWSFWVGLQWQPTAGLWMAHCGRQNEFMLISPVLMRRLIREARGKQLLVTSYQVPPA
jgi:hypothetical protein